jgi:hypothetical protein
VCNSSKAQRAETIPMPYQRVLSFIYLPFQFMVTTDIMQEFFGDNIREVVVATHITGPTLIFWGIFKKINNKAIKAVHDNRK